MKKIQFFLIALLAFMVINAQAQSLYPFTFTGIPTTVATNSTNTFISSVYQPHGYIQAGLGLVQPYTIWITESNTGTNLNTNVYNFTYVYDGTTNTPATTNGAFTGATFPITNVTFGSNIVNRHYYYFSGTNLTGLGGFYISSIVNLNTNNATNYPVSISVLTSQ